MSMKIIVVNDYGRIVGGAAKIAIMSARALAERGHDVEFFAGNSGIGPELEGIPGLVVTCLESGPHTRDPKVLRGALRGFWFRKAAKAMRQILSSCDPKDTVVHLHAYRETLTTSVADVAIKMGFVTVYTAHEYTLGCPYGGFFDFRRNRACPLTGLSAACLRTKCNAGQYWRKLWYFAVQWYFAKVRRIPARLSHTLFISKLTEDTLRGYLPANARFSIVLNPIDVGRATPPEITEASPFLYIGALYPHKGAANLARVAKQLGAPITFVGTGTDDEEIKRIYPEAEVTGWVPREEVQRHIQRSRALVLPSAWKEPFGLVAIEAGLGGLPMIVSETSAVADIVSEIGAGATFDPDDPGDIAAKMRPYMDPAFAQKEGDATREALRKFDFTMARHVDDLERVYRSELDRRT